MSPSPPYDELRELEALGEFLEMDEQFIVWGTGQTIFSSIGQQPAISVGNSAGWMPGHYMGIDLHDRCVELRQSRRREWLRCRIVADEPAGEWTWQQLRDGLVDVGRLPLDAVIYHVTQRPGEVFVSFWSKTGPAGAVPVVGRVAEALADVP